MIRTRSTDSIVSEIEMLHLRYASCSTTTSRVELTNGSSDLQERSSVEFLLHSVVKSELFTPEQVEASSHVRARTCLHGARAALAFVSGDDRVRIAVFAAISCVLAWPMLNALFGGRELARVVGALRRAAGGSLVNRHAGAADGGVTAELPRCDYFAAAG